MYYKLRETYGMLVETIETLNYSELDDSSPSVIKGGGVWSTENFLGRSGSSELRLFLKSTYFYF